MQPEFWHERWQQNQIGFHRSDIHPWLVKFWPELQLVTPSRVFVPLCGKSRDLLWLRAQGHGVVGVELSPIAVEAFFEENRLVPTISEAGQLKVYEADGIRLYCGDFFDLTPAEMRNVAGCYDRAALVALPPELRERYARHLARILPSSTAMLLIAFEYPQHQLAGPPFSVDGAEVERLFGSFAKVRLLEAIDILDQEPKFRAKGVTRLKELVYSVQFAVA
jgi:thiopurine S-methyltransferase